MASGSDSGKGIDAPSPEALAASLRERRRKRAAEGRGDERRTHDRFACRFDALLTGPDKKKVFGFTHDLSIGGLFVEASRQFPLGTEIELWLALPNVPEGITVQATVRWTKPNGMGLQLGLVGAKATHAILATLKMLATAEDAEAPEPEG